MIMDGSSPTGSNISPPLQSLSELSLSCSPHYQRAAGASSPEVKAEERGLYLIQLLLVCANYVSAGNMERTNMCMEQISYLACLTGDPMQRLATYFMEALAARITKPWRGLYRALALHSAQSPSMPELVAAKQVFSSLFPYLRFASDAVNLMILEAMQGEKVVHVIDLDASEPAQWMDLLRLLHRRQGGPPHLKITGIHEKREVLQQTGSRLAEEAERLDIPFRFIPLVTRLENLTDDMLKVKTGEAVAVSSVLQLHPLLAEDDPPQSQLKSVSVSPPALTRFNGKRPRDEDLLRSVFTQYRSPTADGTLGDLLKRERHQRSLSNPETEDGAAAARTGNLDRLLRVLRSASPKMVVVVEQESNHNGGRLEERLMEALFYYGAMFDCLESALPQQCIERVTLEKHMFGQQIENIVACEGAERVERHEKLERWMRRLHRAGLTLVPLTYATVMHARRLVHTYSSHSQSYRILEDKGCLTICWQEQPLYTVSAWQT